MRCQYVTAEPRVDGALQKFCMSSRKHRVVEGVARLEKGERNYKEESDGNGRVSAEARERKEYQAHNTPDGDLPKEELRVRAEHAAHAVELGLKDAELFCSPTSCCHRLLLN